MPDAAVELTIERVLCAVECVPAGRVVSYGDIAELVGTSARRVGAVMASAGPGCRGGGWSTLRDACPII